MKIQNIFFSFFTIILIFGINSCKKNDPAIPNQNVTIGFDNVVGTADLAFNTNYVNSSNETFKVSRFDYYISNISLEKTDGTVFTVAQDDSYFLIKENAPTSQRAELKNVPEGDYQSITFTVGVDSIRSCAPIDKRTGALDPATNGGMYWTWNSGYIFSMLEGSSAVSGATSNLFQFHVGGFGGFNSITSNNIRIVTVPFVGMARVGNNTNTKINLKVDALKIFGANTASSDNRVSIAANPTVMGSPAVAPIARKLAGNYQNGVFSFASLVTNPK